MIKIVVGLKISNKVTSITSSKSIVISNAISNFLLLTSQTPHIFLSFDIFTYTTNINANKTISIIWTGKTIKTELKTPPSPILIIIKVQFKVIKNALYIINAIPNIFKKMLREQINNNPVTIKQDKKRKIKYLNE